MGQSHLEAALEFQIRVAGLPEPEREYRFWPGRRFRVDFHWHDEMLIAEVEGGTWQYGAHQRPARFESDCIKYNEAVLMGYKVVRFTSDMVNDGRALATLERALGDGRG